MTTAELVLWMDKAIGKSEASWVPPSTDEIPVRMGYYKIGRHDALGLTKPRGAKEYEVNIAHALIQWGNDIEDWVKQIN